jgi:hypothetical protein
MIKVCRHCEDEFETTSRAKQIAGGKIDECPDCSEESGEVYVGLTAGDGKVGECTIMAFKDPKAASQYVSNWQRSTGYHRGKSCQLGGTTSLDMSYTGARMVGQFGGNRNHKGNA